ncbi:MAG: helix-turn-helix transcriptional regulator [Parasporobacterium sp.]|nr:helix-turn-helix transcriptional regulator [Parasporobacterium sp.]
MNVYFALIGNRIQRTRKQQGISQEQLAESVGIGTGHLSHIENGHKSPSADTMINIAVSLNIPVDDLLVDFGIPHKTNPELLDGCSPDEKDLICELLHVMKPILHKYWK